MIRRGGLVALASLIALGAAAAPAAAAPSAPGFGVTATKSTYRSGELPELRFTVANGGSAPCQVPGVPDAVLQVASAARDGKPLQPVVAWSTFADGYDSAVTARATTLAPGQRATFPVMLVAGAVPASHPVPGGGAVTALWPVAPDGAYRLSFVYSAPHLTDQLCAGLDYPATVTFRVGGSDRPQWTVWVLVAGGTLLVLVLLLLVVVFVFRRRRPGPVATALLFLVVVAVAVSTGGRPALASVNDKYGDAAFRSVVDGCLDGFTGAGDPAGIMNDINNPSGPVVTIRPQLSGQVHRTFDTPLAPGGQGSSTILFNSKSDFVHPDDGDLDPCAELYHELYHAWEYIKGTASSELCDDTGIETDEVEASFAENKYRKAKGLPHPRTTYDRKKLPPSLDECKKKPKPKSSGAAKKCKGYAGSCGQSNGDPHLVTFDRRYYDFQAVGEFVAVRSASGDLEVQTRQSPILGSRTVSTNAAVALKVGTDRLGFYLTGDAVSLRLNGSALDLADGARTLPGGGTVTKREGDVYLSGPGYDVDWPDGSTAYLDPIGRWGLRLYVALAPARHGQVTGLLGNFDGDPGNDLPAASPSFEQLYHAYADSWRVTGGTSLFDYGPGQSTATFTDRTFPDRPASASNLPPGVRDGADAVCRWSGVTDPELLQACILDVAVTGEAAFAVGSADTQQTSGGAAGSGTPAGGTDATLTTTQNTYTFTGTAGQIVYIAATSSTVDACGVLSLRAPDGSVIGSGCIISGTGGIDRTVLKDSGTYQILLTANGTAALRIYTVHDDAGTVSIDGSPVTATVAQPGATATYSFDATAGQKVFVEVTDATIPEECGIVVLHGPASALAAGCVISGKGYVDGTVLPTTGRYSIVLDPTNANVGTVRLRVIEDRDQHSDIAVNGPAVTATVGQPGAVAVLSFDGTAGQRIAVAGDGATVPDQCGVLVLHGPDGAAFASGCIIYGAVRMDPVTLPASGRYQLILDPERDDTGQIPLRLSGA
jgi:hypothetical protein